MIGKSHAWLDGRGMATGRSVTVTGARHVCRVHPAQWCDFGLEGLSGKAVMIESTMAHRSSRWSGADRRHAARCARVARSSNARWYARDAVRRTDGHGGSGSASSARPVRSR